MTDSTPATKPDPYPVRPIRMPAELWQRAVTQAESTGTTGSALVRTALAAYLDKAGA